MTKLLGLGAGVAGAVALSMPFDAIRTRLHTMRPLPNGVYPYENALDCFVKMYKYECNFSKFSHFSSLYSGG